MTAILNAKMREACPLFWFKLQPYLMPAKEQHPPTLQGDQIRLPSTIALSRPPLPGQPHIDMQIQEGSCVVPTRYRKYTLCGKAVV